MEHIKVVISDEIKNKIPQLRVATLEIKVTNTETCPELWETMLREEQQIRNTYTTETLKQRTTIAATRAAYRTLGKDPSRYRPSNEALSRRILQGKNLYHINTVVDINNLVSMKWGYSIGGFDYQKIKGNTLTLAIGKAGEPYEGIGRGPLNIEFLPVYRDEIGGIGTPTSDNERTKIDLSTSHLLFTISAYEGDTELLTQCVDEFIQILECYAEGREVFVNYY